ncbi:MAG: hypothetical protein K9N55_07645 [Phycisphaerae bacterium]|nr:hypothetical protein [Phycisphaerae bacterium]
MKDQIRTYLSMLVVVMALLGTCTSTQAVTGDYSITIDASGDLATSSGTWLQYPDGSQDYFIWFHSSGLDPNLMGDITITGWLQARDPSLPVTYAVRCGWTLTNSSPSAPPSPAEVGTDLGSFFTTKYVSELTNVRIQAGEYKRFNNSYLNQFYLPEWFYVCVSGTNLSITGNIEIEGIEFVPPAIGACCDTTTGDCYLTDEGKCFIGYTYLGDGTTCANCQTQNFIWDFGDAPSSYPVTKAQNGAQHTIQSGMYLGIGINAEVDGQPSASANLDSWDDGVAFTSQIKTGQSTTVTVTASMLGVINAWLDLNLDGDWADIGEHIIVDEPVSPGQNYLSFYVPVNAIAGQSFARFRYDSTGGMGYTGLAPDGEVEDYTVTILSGSNPNPDPDPDPDPDPGIMAKSPTNQFSSKWNQPVDLLDSTYNLVYGWNRVTRRNAIPLVADDWRNDSVLPVQGVKWWGAFDNWLNAEMPPTLPTGFHFGIWSHNPALSKPGTLLWEHTATSWVWAYTGQVQDAQGQIGGEAVFEFTTLLSQDQWFYPSPTPNTVYWLSITPIYPSTATSPTPWGWMTRQSNGTLPAERIFSVYNPVQWPPVVGTTYATGTSIIYNSTPWDVAFELITSQPGGGASGGSNSDLASAIGDLNDDGKIDINDLYILLGFVLNP